MHIEVRHLIGIRVENIQKLKFLRFFFSIFTYYYLVIMNSVSIVKEEFKWLYLQSASSVICATVDVTGQVDKECSSSSFRLPLCTMDFIFLYFFSFTLYPIHNRQAEGTWGPSVKILCSYQDTYIPYFGAVQVLRKQFFCNY